MPSVSRAQHRFMGMSASPTGRAWLSAHGKKAASVSVAKEYLSADKGKKLSSLMKRKPSHG